MLPAPGGTDDVEDLLSVAEVARKLGVSKASVYTLVEKGALPTVRVLNTIRIRPADLRAYIDRGGAGEGGR